jgi:2-dehydropantoate 2-reductase
MKWSKMLTNLLTNASSAILDMSPVEILSHPDLYRVEIAQLREAIAVMRAHNIPIVDLPGTPVRLYAMVIDRFPLWLSRIFLSRIAGRGRGHKMPSFHIDLHSGRGKSEVDYLNGAIVRFGARMGIASPVNRWLNQTLLAITQGNLPTDTYAHQPEKYMAGCFSTSKDKITD